MSRFFLKYLLLELSTHSLYTRKTSKSNEKVNKLSRNKCFHFSHFCNQIYRRWRISFVIYRMVSLYLLHLFAETVYHAIIASHTIALFTISVCITMVMISVVWADLDCTRLASNGGSLMTIWVSVQCLANFLRFTSWVCNLLANPSIVRIRGGVEVKQIEYKHWNQFNCIVISDENWIKVLLPELAHIARSRGSCDFLETLNATSWDLSD